VCTFAGACGDSAPIPDHDLHLRVTTDTDDVDLGRPFPLTVVRVWEKDLVPEAWKDDWLAPLAVRLAGTSRRTDDRRVEETLRYDAFAFRLDDVVVPPPTFRATARLGSEARAVQGGELRLRVKRALDPAAPGPPELPGGLLREPVRWGRWGAAAGIAAALTALLLHRRRVAARIPPDAVAADDSPATPPPPTAQERALLRIALLRDRPPRTAAETQSWWVEVSAVLRDYVTEQCAVRAAEMTTDELLAAPAIASAVGDERRRTLAGVLRDCDFVKFARHEPSAAERTRSLGAAESFLRGTGTA